MTVFWSIYAESPLCCLRIALEAGDCGKEYGLPPYLLCWGPSLTSSEHLNFGARLSPVSSPGWPRVSCCTPWTWWPARGSSSASRHPRLGARHCCTRCALPSWWWWTWNHPQICRHSARSTPTVRVLFDAMNFCLPPAASNSLASYLTGPCHHRQGSLFHCSWQVPVSLFARW